MKTDELNFAGKLANIFIDSKLTPLFILVCMAIGLFSLVMTPKEETPQIVIPSIKVVLPVPGFKAEEIERLVVKQTEAALGSISGVEHTAATVKDNVGVILIEFEVGFDKSNAVVLVHERLNTILSNLPENVQTPLITAIDVDDLPFYTVTLTSDHYDEQQVRAMAEKMSDHIRSLNDVSIVNVIAGERPNAYIKIDPVKLEAFNISIEQVESAIRASNIALPVGTFVNRQQLNHLYLDSNLHDLNDIENLIVATVNQTPVYLGEVSEISRQKPNERKKMSFFAYRTGGYDSAFSELKPAVTIAISKRTGTNAVEVANLLDQTLDDLKEYLVPEEMDLHVTRNIGKRADQAVSDLVENLVLSMITVVLVSIFFISIKEALIIGGAIPLILGISIGACFIYGVTINRITLFALILSMGMLVDGATVVIDNIYRSVKSQNKSREVMVAATNQIGGATNLATLSIMLVFISLIVVTGMSGEYFFPLTFTVPVAMFASLIVAYIVVPWAANRWTKPQPEQKDSMFERVVVSRFKVLINQWLSIKYQRRLFLITVFVLVLLSCLQLAWQFVRPQGPAGPLSSGTVSVAVMPKNDTNSFFIALTMPKNTMVEDVAKVAFEIGKKVEMNAYVTDYQTYLGMSGAEEFNALYRGFTQREDEFYSEIRINLINKSERSLKSFEIVKDIRATLEPIQARYPEARIQLVEDPPGPPTRNTIEAEVYGNDAHKMEVVAEIVKQTFANGYAMVEVHHSNDEEMDETRLIVDREKALLLGVSPQRIVNLLTTMSSGKDVGILHDSNEEDQVKIRLTVSEQHKFDPQMLAMMTIQNNQGINIPLLELITLKQGKQSKPILRKDGERVIYVGGELVDSAPFFAVMDINSRLKAMIEEGTLDATIKNLSVVKEKPATLKGEQIHWQGEVRLSLDMFRDLTGALIVAILTVYALLVAYYKSFGIPMIAMAAIPLSLIGVFPGHWLLDAPFSGPSLIGIIALAGIVMRNALLIIDFSAVQLSEGYSIRDAISRASSIRLPAISLTASTVVIGSLFMLNDPVFGGLAVSLIFGTITATILTPLVIPILLQKYVSIRGTDNLFAVADKA